ncbi:SDR family NAD(P)-dependent oxidoreductase [Luminiphilus sp.]|jgi:NAD(P)-dependent dehydrogenase (short-subunit alcohol dehydrogenase family)|nr:SDR family NAD(P)-dependent oxidoreductase [Luminiphilus sp.]MDA8590546.1 SDR family NAD(P)-dependent oxidoreductase [Luminiphilus sp.]MDB2511348.1 SDR family NAD(P)-dependent oxidoreductase [Luminiphilus sp.]MDB2660865.1 SDR family NAD(P)-dependent oxidoreductase [Luminiphilus sp.]MDB2691684.1 SDR family NAD(P)-dependent oxidoreductase [Luminiphilus sp.]
MEPLSDIEETRLAVIVGGGGAIAQALAVLWCKDPTLRVVVVSRSPQPMPNVQSMLTDYTEESLSAIASTLSDLQIPMSRLVVTNGVLSGDTFSPERKISELNATAFQHVLAVNALLPLQVLSAFWALIRHGAAPRIAVLSARVGSLSDNRLGGWYSYRASKAALNMMLKTASIEAQRINRQAKFIAYHPGTVDSPLSQPFQRSVPKEKLFTPEFTASQLTEVLNQAVADGELSYVDWAGETIAW